MTDATFLDVQFRETPVHVGGINRFAFQEGAHEQTFNRRLPGLDASR